MSKEFGKRGSKKQLILMILQGYSGDAEGINAAQFYEEAASFARIDRSTVEKYVREQIGQVHIRNGVIIVESGAMLLSNTHRVRPDRDNGDGRGISNGVKRWNWHIGKT